MYQRGIRGAITVDCNTNDAVKKAVIELIDKIKKSNKFDESQISHIIFTLTDDVDCIYPAKIAREEFPELKYVPMMCLKEMNIQNSLRKCLRVLICVNTELDQKDIKHIYLKGAEILREDLKQ